MKRFITFLVVFLLAFNITASLSYATSSSKTINDLKKQEDAIKNSMESTEKLLDETKNQKQSLFSELEVLDNLIEFSESELESITTSLEETTATLTATEIKLIDTISLKDRQYELLRQRIQIMYEDGDVGYLQILLQSEDFADFLNRMEYINEIVTFDQNIFSDIKDTEQLIIMQRDEIEVKKSLIEQLKADEISRMELLEETKAKKVQFLEELEHDQQLYEQKLDELEASEAEVKSLIKKAQEEAERARKEAERQAALKKQQAQQKTQQAQIKYTGGVMAWPVPGYYSLSDGYVQRNNPISGRYEFHTGIDIPAKKGTNVVAAADGIVIKAATMSGYGMAVIIDHGSNVSTLYAHNSKLLVTTGQTVKRGEAIALVGSTGNSTGNHCHFEVRINGSHTNPLSYLQ